MFCCQVWRIFPQTRNRQTWNIKPRKVKLANNVSSRQSLVLLIVPSFLSCFLPFSFLATSFSHLSLFPSFSSSFSSLPLCSFSSLPLWFSSHFHPPSSSTRLFVFYVCLLALPDNAQHKGNHETRSSAKLCVWVPTCFTHFRSIWLIGCWLLENEKLHKLYSRTRGGRETVGDETLKHTYIYTHTHTHTHTQRRELVVFDGGLQ